MFPASHNFQSIPSCLFFFVCFYCSYNFADDSLLSYYLLSVPQQEIRTLTWPGGSWWDDEYLSLTCGQQSPGDRTMLGQISGGTHACPRGPHPSLLPAVTAHSRSSQQSAFPSPRVKPHLLPAWRRQGAEGRSLRPPAATMSSEVLGTALVVSCLLSGWFLLVTQNWGSANWLN